MTVPQTPAHCASLYPGAWGGRSGRTWRGEIVMPEEAFFPPSSPSTLVVWIRYWKQPKVSKIRIAQIKIFRIFVASLQTGETERDGLITYLYCSTNQYDGQWVGSITSFVWCPLKILFHTFLAGPKPIIECSHSVGMNSRATQLKFGCPRMSHYASHYHYGSQWIVCLGQWECWTGW